MVARVAVGACVPRCQSLHYQQQPGTLTSSFVSYPAVEDSLTDHTVQGTIQLSYQSICLSLSIDDVTKVRGPFSTGGLPLPERDDHDEQRNAAIVASLPLCRLLAVTTHRIFETIVTILWQS